MDNMSFGKIYFCSNSISTSIGKTPKSGGMNGKIQFSIMQLDKQDTLIIFLTSTYKNKEKTGEKLMELMIPSKKRNSTRIL